MKREIKIGLVVMAAILSAYIVLTWAKSTHLFSTHRNSYELIFADVNGLKTGDAVNVFGINSGNVTAIHHGKGGAIVEIGLDAEVKLFADASAQIQVKELMGGKQISVHPGFGPSEFAKGTVIQGNITLDFSTAFSKLGNFLDNISGESADSLVRNLNRLAVSFSQIGDEMNNKEIGSLFDDISSSADRLDRLLALAEQKAIISKVDSALVKVNQLSTVGIATLESVKNVSDQVNETTLPKAEQMMDQLSKILDETETAMTDVKDLLQQMKNKQTVAGKIFYDEAFGKELDHAFSNLNVTLDHIRSKKIYVALRLGKQQKLFPEETEE